MTLATKNNAIIVKDGRLAENCGCCGGNSCCAFDSLNVPDCGPVQFFSTRGGCVSSQGRKRVLSCDGYLGSVTVSGLQDLVGIEGQCPAPPPERLGAISSDNGTYVTNINRCGFSSLTRFRVIEPFLGVETHQLIVQGAFYTARVNGQQCPSGFVSFRVSVNIFRNLSAAFIVNRIRLLGSADIQCVSLDSIPDLMAFLEGYSTEVTLTGDYRTPAILICTFEPQTINVSFAGNPLP